MGHGTTRGEGSGMDMDRGTDRARVTNGARQSLSAPGFRLSRLPPGRVAVLDVVRFASRQPTIHGLLDVDVTSARQRLASVSGNPTLTAFVVATLARAVAECPEVNARRAGRTVISFERVDVVVTVEREVDGALAPVPLVVVDAAHKDLVQISSELQEAKARPLDGVAGDSLLGRLPSPLRRLTAIMARRIPKAAARFGPPIGVTSLGMFGSGWGIPLSPLTLVVTVGGTVARPVLSEGQFENHQFLPLTLSFDHSVIDGAPAARFATDFRHLLETASVLDEVG